MPFNEVEKAKIVVEIARLKKEATKLEEEARDEESAYASAWNFYGSELAGPSRIIEKNRHQAELLEEELGLFQAILDGETSLSDHIDTQRLDLATIEEDIGIRREAMVALEKQRQEKCTTLSRLEKLQRIIAN